MGGCASVGAPSHDLQAVRPVEPEEENELVKQLSVTLARKSSTVRSSHLLDESSQGTSFDLLTTFDEEGVPRVDSRCGMRHADQPPFSLRAGDLQHRRTPLARGGLGAAYVEKSLSRADTLSSESKSAVYQKPALEPHPTFSKLFQLERDGYIVQSSTQGAIQFGIPPESIKDCLTFGLEVPTYYVIYGEMFDRECGLSIAEFEFPIYYNYFVKRRKVTILAPPPLQGRILAAFQETLLGPAQQHVKLESDFVPIIPKDAWPDFEAEGGSLDPSRSTLKLADLVNFVNLEPTKVTKLGDSVEVKIMQVTKPCGSHEPYFLVSEFNEVIAKIPVKLKLSCQNFDVQLSHTFQAPLFGITVLGSSHGFDPRGNTTGFVLWINRFGIMVDPPPNSSHILERLGIVPNRIQGIILTHCHADHDAGTFQKILRQRQVKLYTTVTIKDSFVRKYAAITGFSVPFLQSLFEFRKVRIGEPMNVGCCSIFFNYTLHTIPCIGFRAVWRDSSIAYSADTNYSPKLINGMFEKGIIGAGRRDQLMNFAWDSTVVLHEMGVPPIHTANVALEEVCLANPGLKERLFVVHAAAGACPGFQQLGEMDTIAVPVVRCEDCVRREVLDVLRSQHFMRPLRKSKSLMLRLAGFAEVLTFSPGQLIVEHGQPINDVWILMGGMADCLEAPEPVTPELSRSGTKGSLIGDPVNEPEREECVAKGIFPLDIVGCHAILETHEAKERPKRGSQTADDTHEFSIRAKTDVTIMRIQVDKFVEIIVSSPAASQVWHFLRQNDQVASTLALSVIKCNPRLSSILELQLCTTDFLSLLKKESVDTGDCLQEPCLIIDGYVSVFSRSSGDSGTFRGISSDMSAYRPRRGIGRGSLIGNMNKLALDEDSDLRVLAETPVEYFVIRAKGFQRFLKQFPGVLLQLLDETVMEGLFCTQRATTHGTGSH